MSVKFNFSEKLTKDVSELDNFGGGGGWFNFQEGDNRIRVLSPTTVLSQHFMGKGNKPATCYGKDKGCPFHEAGSSPAGPKWLCYVIDRIDGRIKIAKLPYTIIKAIAALQANEEYTFLELPMPYDINIMAKNSGTKEVDYHIIPSRKETALTEEELEEFSKQKDIEEVVQKMKDKAQGQYVGGEQSTTKRDIDVNKIPIIETEPDESEKDEITVDDVPF